MRMVRGQVVKEGILSCNDGQLKLTMQHDGREVEMFLECDHKRPITDHTHWIKFKGMRKGKAICEVGKLNVMENSHQAREAQEVRGRYILQQICNPNDADSIDPETVEKVNQMEGLTNCELHQRLGRKTAHLRVTDQGISELRKFFKKHQKNLNPFNVSTI